VARAKGRVSLSGVPFAGGGKGDVNPRPPVYRELDVKPRPPTVCVDELSERFAACLMRAYP